MTGLQVEARLGETIDSNATTVIMAQNTWINNSGIDAVLYSVCLSKRSGKESDIIEIGA
jgi:hypothetical protein